MNDLDVAAVRESWDEAGRVLGVAVQTRDCWLTDDDGQRHEVTAIVHDFGARSGMALLAPQHASLSSLAAERGLGYSVLGASYETFSRPLFEDTLNDWGWCGEGDPPDWYTGKPWS